MVTEKNHPWKKHAMTWKKLTQKMAHWSNAEGTLIPTRTVSYKRGAHFHYD